MSMKKVNELLLGLVLTASLVFAAGCGDDDDMDPEEENEEEVITDVTLTFTPDGGGTAITASAEDPDGDGPQDLEITDDIVLQANTTYTMTMELLNALDPDDVESISEEVEEEADEHMFFFAWTGDVFSDPTGNGNADNRADDVNYNDEDGGGLPLGLSTGWTTGDAGSGTFRIVLKHQPEAPDGSAVKTETSSISDGDTDVDITWDITVE